MKDTITLAQQFEHWPIDKIKPYEKNPRKHPPAQVAKIAASIVEFGFNNPILVDENKGIIAGEGRLRAAEKLHLEVVPVIELTHLSDAQKRAYILADNRIAMDAAWDTDLLLEEIASLDESGFDLNLTGFAVDELDRILASTGDGLTDEDEVPPVPKEPVSIAGDVWLLGRHRVMCGSSTIPADTEQLINDELVDGIWTDPPYNVNYGDKAEMLEKHKKGHRNTSRILNDNMSSEQFYQFLYDAFQAAHAVAKPGAAIYIAHAETEGLNFRKAFADAGFYQSSCLIWIKNTLVLGRSDYQWRHEPILYGWKPDGPHRWFGRRNKTTIQEFEGSSFQKTGDNEWQITIGEQTLVVRGDNLTVEEAHGTIFYEDKPTRNADHPTMKPVALIERMVCNSTQRGDLVYDLFGGSGSTLIASEKTGRSARLMELDPKYCDVIVKRWEAYTGKSALLEATGEMFIDIEKARKK